LAITIGTIVIVPGIGVGPGGVLDSVRYLAENDWLQIAVQGSRKVFRVRQACSGSGSGG
jgi:hypothetical protein